MFDWRIAFVPAFLMAQAVLVQWAANFERPPVPPDLSRFPATFGEWKQLRQDTVEPAIATELRADRLLSCTYIGKTANSAAGLFVAWFRSQRGGVSQPHSPKVCLPGSGWIPQKTGVMTLNTADGTIGINRYIVAKGKDRAVVLYWFETPRRVVASEWASKLWLISDAVLDKRTDTALVRIVTWTTGGSDEAATATATQFAREVYPLLREALPR